MKRTLLVVGMLGLLSQPAQAQDEWFTIYSPGNESCGSFLDAKANRTDPHDWRFVQLQAWLAGCMTVLNYINARDFHIDHANLLASTDWEGAYAWIDKFCRENPRKSFVDAAFALAAHLGGL